MTQQEWEPFLADLSRRLSLAASSRRRIAEELADHLELRAADLEAGGLPREAAVRQALAEFGDAAQLADHFTQSHHRQHRRQIMRYSALSATIIVTTFVMASFYWPGQPPEPKGRVVAQVQTLPPSGQAVLAGSAPAAPTLTDLERKLRERTGEIQFADTAFEDVIKFMADRMETTILLDQARLGGLGVDPQTPVTLSIRDGAISTRGALELMLMQLTEADLDFVTRDDVLLLTSSTNAYQVKVYNCRDLLGSLLEGYPPGSEGPAAGLYGLPGGAAAPGMSGPGGFGGGGGLGGVSGESTIHSTSPAGRALINVLLDATHPHGWAALGTEGGTISEFNGLITVRHSQRVHDQLEEVLQKLRAARQ